jgi:tetratricopeptide (TPR) repeat protein
MERMADIDNAITRYESYVRADAQNPLLWLNLGELYHRVSRHDEAIACFERCLNDHPQFGRARGHLARVFISQHRFAEAQKVLEGMLAAGDQDPNLLYNLGLSVYYQRRWPEAEAYFLRALQAGVTTPDSYAYLARCRHYAGDLQQAIELCQQWIEAARDAQSLGYMALLQMDQGNMEDAQRIAQEVLAESPDNTHAGIVAGTASIEAQEIESACRHFEQVLAVEPDNARAWLGVGLARLYQQRHEEAIVALDQALQLIPDSVGIAVTLGWAHLTAKDVTTAERTFRRAVEIDRNFAEAHGGLASALALQARIDEAQQAIRRALRLDARGFGAAFARTVVLKLQGRHQAATDLLAGLLQQSPRPDGKTLLEQLDLFTRKHPPAGSGLPAARRPPSPSQKLNQ